MENQLSRHLLATIAHRASQAIVGAPDNFPALAIGEGVRTPVEILRHMSRVLTYAHSQFEPQGYGDGYEFPAGTWEWEVERFYAVLEKLDQVLVEAKAGSMTIAQLIQGPLADAITHVGQLTMMRRLAGSPVTYENFIKADIRAGKLRP